MDVTGRHLFRRSWGRSSGWFGHRLRDQLVDGLNFGDTTIIAAVSKITEYIQPTIQLVHDWLRRRKHAACVELKDNGFEEGAISHLDVIAHIGNLRFAGFNFLCECFDTIFDRSNFRRISSNLRCLGLDGVDGLLEIHIDRPPATQANEHVGDRRETRNYCAAENRNQSERQYGSGGNISLEQQKEQSHEASDNYCYPKSEQHRRSPTSAADAVVVIVLGLGILVFLWKLTIRN